MNKFIIVFLIAIYCTSCTLYIPYETETVAPPAYKLSLVLNVEPEDAKVVVNGRFIGEAYEFSTIQTALTIKRKNTEVVLKKRGFIEEKLDIENYTSGTKRVDMKMRKEDNRSTLPPASPTKQSPPLPEKKEEPVKEKTPQIFVYRLKVSPTSSAIYIDGKFWGTSPEEGITINNLRLKEGQHTIEVFKPGYKSIKKVFTASEKSLKDITLELFKIK